MTTPENNDAKNAGDAAAITATAAENVVVTGEAYSEKWQEIVGVFSKKVGLKIDKVSDALKPLVGEPGDEALGYLADVVNTPDADIKEALAFLNLPKAKLNANIAILRGPKKVEASVSAASGKQGMGFGILPNVPDDESFTRMLKIGGELKIGATEVLSAVKAALANKVGLYALPDKLKRAMEEFSERNDEPSPAEYYRIRNEVTKRKYSEVLSVLEVEGTFVTEGRKNNLFSRLDQYLWPSLIDFKDLLANWQKAWLDKAGGQAMTAFAFQMAAGAAGGQMPPNMLAPPETDGLRDAAEGVINNINKVFAGPNIPVARALAYDAGKIKESLENPALPGMIGAANREAMLKMLGADVSSDFPRLEKNIVRFIMSIMEAKNVNGPEELYYFSAMAELSGMIPWDKLMRISQEKNTAQRKVEKY